MNNNTSIKTWALEDRPREKLLSKGPEALSQSELLAIILGSGSREKSAVALASQLLNSYDHNLLQLAKANFEELTSVKGIGPAKAVSILACLELVKRKLSSEAKTYTQIKSSQDAFYVFDPLFQDLLHEEFWVIYLNRNNRIIKSENLSKGGVAGTVVDQKIIFKRALQLLASSIVLAHNHPSGNLRPSQEDLKITKKIKAGAEILGLKVLDHLIISEEGYFSFSDEGILEI
jgi:DNA repair protein RadC